MSRKPRIILPAAVWAKIRAEYEAGVPVKHLADTFNLTEAAIYRRKKSEEWSREVSVISDDMLSKARQEAEQRIIEHIQEREVDMKQVIDQHKSVSQQIMDRAAALLDAVDKIPDTEVSKKAHALKTLSDVITAQIRNERRTWNIDDKGSDTSLEALLDELDEEEEKRQNSPKPMVIK